MKVICFHNPDEENGFLSNWYLSYFEVDGKTFSSVEQFMMYHKAVCFQDRTIAEQVLATNDVAHIKELGRMVSGYNDNIWNGVRQLIVYEGLLAKFSQQDILKKQLLETKDAILAECAVHDSVWGIGLSLKDEKRFDISQWKGKNLLGYTLMIVRNHLE